MIAAKVALLTVLLTRGACLLLPMQARVPAWPPPPPPADPRASGVYVFFDSTAQEYVVSFPERLKTNRDDEGRMIEFRFQPQFVVEPQISVQVSKGEDGFVYEYQVRNGPGARDAIRWLNFVVSPADSSLTMEHPTWATLRLTGPAVAPQAALIDWDEMRKEGNLGRFGTWSSSPKGQPLEPGGIQTGFRMKSKFLPGLTTLFASTGIALRVPFELPPEVSDQVVPLLSPERNFRITVTIAPKFPPADDPSASPASIAQDYRNALSRLSQDGRLSGGSAFVKEADSLLRAVSANNSRTKIRFLSKPQPGLESEIAAALRLVLDSDPPR